MNHPKIPEPSLSVAAHHRLSFFEAQCTCEVVEVLAGYLYLVFSVERLWKQVKSHVVIMVQFEHKNNLLERLALCYPFNDP